MSTLSPQDPTDGAVRLAPLVLRVAAMAVDLVLVTAVLIVAIVFEALTGIDSPLFLVVVYAVAFISYTGSSVWLTGQTPGKALCNLTIRRCDGHTRTRNPRELAWSFGRQSVGYLVADVFGVGLLLAVVHPRRRCLHDLAFTSEVVIYSMDDRLLSSPEARLREFEGRVKAALAEVDKRYAWAFFLIRWVAKLVLRPAVVLIILRPLFTKTVAHFSSGAPTNIGTPGSTALSAKASTALWLTTSAVTVVIGAQVLTPAAPTAAPFVVAEASAQGSRRGLSIARDESGAVHVAWSQDRKLVVRSRIHGKWSPAITVGGDGGWLVSELTGATCARWSGPNASTSFVVFESCWHNHSWSAPAVIAPADGRGDSVTDYSVARTPDGRAHIAWLNRLVDRRGGIGAEVLCLPCLGGVQLYADRDGRVHFFFNRNADYWEHRVSVDGGTTFMEPTRMGKLPDGTDLGLWGVHSAPDGSIVTLLGRSGILAEDSGLWIRRWTIEGGWDPAIPIFHGGRTDRLAGDVGIDDQGRAIIAWSSLDGVLTMSQQAKANGPFQQPVALDAARGQLVADVHIAVGNRDIDVVWLSANGQITDAPISS